MIKKNLWKLIVASVVILIPMLVGIIIWDLLPETIATHWDASGEPDGFSDKAVMVFLMPSVILVLLWVGMLVTARDHKEKEQSGAVVDLVIILLPILSLVVAGMSFAIALGHDVSVPDIVTVFLGVMMILIGNLLPKARQNRTIGIKIKWTLNSEENWSRTHRFSGKLWFFSGFAILLCVLLPESVKLYPLMAILAVIVIVPLVYSYSLHKKGI
ncbi:MAG: SdpI family protein [Clostridia bacterium]|nr:SdpI family protein [Clostridia bacterium]